eukprot:2457485-Pyramimonas_sp.AAC.1
MGASLPGASSKSAHLRVPLAWPMGPSAGWRCSPRSGLSQERAVVVLSLLCFPAGCVRVGLQTRLLRRGFLRG